MSELPYVNSFRDLTVYKKAKEFAGELFILTKSFPREETYSLTDQIRRSSTAIGAQIAEAWAKRRYEKHFISKLTDADGEQHETQHWIEMGQRLWLYNSKPIRTTFKKFYGHRPDVGQHDRKISHLLSDEIRSNP